ncbi:MAG TPA: undecaprenyl-diphosphate phosphatase [Steroidobacteraceae bacterium]|nr:undecaprenyl-diphosphate phosphatase [Steroidobacteraceae bacterium]
MSVIQVVVLAVIQGFAELLPVSSSAHVVVAEKLMGLDPTAPALTLFLVLLHTGTMCAVIVYFWSDWRRTYFSSTTAFVGSAAAIILATAVTAAIALGLARVLGRVLLPGQPHAEVEELFGHLEFIAPALFAVGVLIVASDVLERRIAKHDQVSLGQSVAIGAIQGLSLPFRGFSRSGATISVGMLVGVKKQPVEAFSFALAVVLTPAVVVREVLRLARQGTLAAAQTHSAVWYSILGGILAFGAGLLALKWISVWLERGRWYYFGVYCMLAAIAVAWLHRAGY